MYMMMMMMKMMRVTKMTGEDDTIITATKTLMKMISKERRGRTRMFMMLMKMMRGTKMTQMMTR